MAPAAWVRRLVTLCDHAPATPFDVVQLVLERELGRNLGEMFEKIDTDPLGSASIAQVIRLLIATPTLKDDYVQLEAFWFFYPFRLENFQ